VRELERMVEQPEISGRDDAVCRPEQAPVAGETDVRATTKAMLDLMALASRCDLTRVAIFMLGNARTKRVYDFLGLTSAHHASSHHASSHHASSHHASSHHASSHHDGIPSMLEALAKIDLWVMQQFIHRDMPIVLAGRGGGAVTPGRHVVYSAREPVANLFISMLQTVGVELERLGDDGTGPLHSLKV
jgi:Protein of unknown function (DUF1552)